MSVEPKHLTAAERRELTERTWKQVGFRSVGTGPDAPRLGSLPGGPEADQTTARPPIDAVIADMQALYGVGDVWSRPGLDRRTRSVITMTALMATYRSDELHLHISNALNVGVTPDEIRETLLHASVYVGMSAWENASKIAAYVFENRGPVQSSG